MRHFCLLALLLIALSGCLPGESPRPAETPSGETLPTAGLARTRSPEGGVPRATRSPEGGVPRATRPPVPVGDDAEAVGRAAREGLERDATMLAAAFRGADPVAALPEPEAGSLGDDEQFWVLDLSAGVYYSTTATLEAQSEHLNIYVADGLFASREDLERSTQRFEEQTVPALTAIFEGQADPPLITVVIASIPGAAGYFSSEDLLPRSANPYSNQRPMIFMSPTLQAGTAGFDSTLAHEVQHLLHQRLQPSAALWFNEGASMLVERLLNYADSSFGHSYIQQPDLQLNSWADSPGASIGHYGQSQLFLSYLHERLGNRLPLARLAREDAGDQLDRFVALTGDADLGDLVADWSIANLLNDPNAGDGRYGYRALSSTVQPGEISSEQISAEVSQLGADYLLFEPSDQQRTALFEGERTVALTAAQLDEGEQAWWSGRGDNRLATLTTTLDLRGLEQATLRFQLWHDLELDYDYGFLAASTDGGRSWRALPGRHTSDSNPRGLSYGPGYTGRSADRGGGGWLDEEIDLSTVAGNEVVLGFWVVNDQGYHTSGLLVKDLALEELDQPLVDWQARGFVTVHNRLPQSWELRLVELGSPPEVRVVEVEDGRAEITLPTGARSVLIVIGTTPETTEPGRYELRLLP